MQIVDLPRIDYRGLATWLGALGPHADCGALVARLRTYAGADRLVPAVAALPPSAEWFHGLRVVAEQLHAENPRFDVGVFEEWACEAF